MSFDVTTLALAKSYTDQHGGSGGGENTIYIPAKLNQSGETPTIETSVTFEQIDAAYKSGQEQILKLFMDGSGEDAYLMSITMANPGNFYYFGMNVGENSILASVSSDGSDDYWNFITYSLIEMSKAEIVDELKPSRVTGSSGTSITLADNTEYRLVDVTNLTITYPSGYFECWMHMKFAGETITVTFPTGTSYIGTLPDFKNGETWELSIKDGVVISQKVGDGT